MRLRRFDQESEGAVLGSYTPRQDSGGAGAFTGPDAARWQCR